MKITIIGNGIMAQSLALGLARTYEIQMIGRDIKKLQLIKEKLPNIEIKQLEDKEDISGKNILFCVKPFALESISARLVGEANSLISILAGTTLDFLRKNIKAKSYIRAMPNIAASVHQSMTTLVGDLDEKKLANEIFSKIGQTVWLNTEYQLDIATAVAGSGPAFLALIAEALADAAVKEGIERHIANHLVQGLFLGTSLLLKESKPSFIKDSVMSPGGTTAAGYAALEEYGVRNAMIKAIESSYGKAKELSKK